MTAARRVLVAGATGSIGRAVVDAVLRRGHHAVALVRPDGADSRRGLPEACEVHPVDPERWDAEVRDVVSRASCTAVISCIASRTGAPDDAWAVDHRANLDLLRATEEAGVEHFVLLSAICVQKPRLEFQHAKLAFEDALRASSVPWSIVRATAFFKSISGQVDRVKAGKPFLIFGDGRLNACKPIADEDLADFLVDCIERPEMRGRVLPIGGPGPALTPRDQGEILFDVVGREPRFRSVPPVLLDLVVAVLALVGRVVPRVRAKAELARIGRYYATESMLVWDDVGRRFDADATPEYGTRTLADYYRRLVRGELRDERGDHAIL